MAISTQVFGSGNNATVAEALATILEETDLFDDVQFDASTATVTCTKDEHTVFSVNLGVSASGTFLTFQNAENDFSDGQQTWWDIVPSGPASISIAGKTVLCVFSSTESPPGSGGWTIKTWSFCIDKTDTDSIGLCFYQRRRNDTLAYSATTNSLTFDHGFIKDPIIITDQVINSSYVIATSRYNRCEKFMHTYNIRYSQSLHSTTATMAGVVPYKLEIDDKTYLTDGIFLISDSDE